MLAHVLEVPCVVAYVSEHISNADMDIALHEDQIHYLFELLEEVISTEICFVLSFACGNFNLQTLFRARSVRCSGFMVMDSTEV